MALLVIYLIVWTAVDTPSSVTDLTMMGDATVALHYVCASASNFWEIAAFGWESLLLLSTTVLAYQSREVIKQLKDSHGFIFLVYTHFIFLLMRVIVHIVMFSRMIPAALFFKLIAILLEVETICAILVNFSPKFSGIFANKPNSLSSAVHVSTVGGRKSYISGVKIPEGGIPKLIRKKNSRHLVDERNSSASSIWLKSSMSAGAGAGASASGGGRIACPPKPSSMTRSAHEIGRRRRSSAHVIGRRSQEAARESCASESFVDVSALRARVSSYKEDGGSLVEERLPSKIESFIYMGDEDSDSDGVEDVPARMSALSKQSQGLGDSKQSSMTKEDFLPDFDKSKEFPDCMKSSDGACNSENKEGPSNDTCNSDHKEVPSQKESFGKLDYDSC